MASQWPMKLIVLTVLLKMSSGIPIENRNLTYGIKDNYRPSQLAGQYNRALEDCQSSGLQLAEILDEQEFKDLNKIRQEFSTVSGYWVNALYDGTANFIWQETLEVVQSWIEKHWEGGQRPTNVQAGDVLLLTKTPAGLKFKTLGPDYSQRYLCEVSSNPVVPSVTGKPIQPAGTEPPSDNEPTTGINVSGFK